jgi:hypothetical protein
MKKKLIKTKKITFFWFGNGNGNGEMKNKRMLRALLQQVVLNLLTTLST